MLQPRRTESLRIQDAKDHREYIAIKAMVAILKSEGDSIIFAEPAQRAKELARDCYAIADAMIVQKNKLPNNPPDSNE